MQGGTVEIACGGAGFGSFAQARGVDSAWPVSWALTEWGGALVDDGEAIRLKPDGANAYYGRGLIFKAQNQNSAAIAAFQQYLKLKAGSSDGFTEYAEKAIGELQESYR